MTPSVAEPVAEDRGGAEVRLFLLDGESLCCILSGAAA